MSRRIIPLFLSLALGALGLAPSAGANLAQASAWPLEQRGSAGPNVVAVQYLLAAHGYSLSVDGDFGSQTAHSVALFQAAHGLVADGIVGSITWPRLIVTVRRGSEGSAVKAVKYVLRYKFRADLSVDGYFGSVTEAAVIAFQRAHDLSPDGIAGAYTWLALAADSAPPAAPAPVRATLTATPHEAARGGAVFVSGTGFAPGEIVDLYFAAVPGLVTATRAASSGLLPITRLVVPATLAPGIHTIDAVGASSHRVARASIIVYVPAAPTPTPTPVHVALTATPLTVNRGGVVTVSGRGFAPYEIVDLYFIALPHVVTAARASATGILLATGVSVPYGLAPGAHTLIALGASSRRVARVTLTVVTLAPHIAVSASTVSPGASVTVAGQGFSPGEGVTLALNGAALVTAPSVIVASASGTFSAAFVVPSRLLRGANTLSAVGNRSRVAAVAVLTGVLPVAARFYIAGGLNTATAHSQVRLLNTAAQPATVRLTFFFGSGATDTKLVAVAPTSEKVVSVASLEPFTGPFGLYIEADRAVTAQLDVARDGQDGDVLLGNTGLATTWYLAEGYTGLTFHESVTILNTNFNAPAHVRLNLLPSSGHGARTAEITVPPHAEYVVDVNSLMPGQALSVIATSDLPIAVERTITFGNDGYGVTMQSGATSPATSWLFAEGTTTTRFQTFLSILNPNAVPALVTASFFSQTGGSLGSKTIVVPGLSRATLKLNNFLSASGIASVVTSNMPIVAERPEYFGNPNDPYTAGSDVFGRNGAGLSWTFPGGETSDRNEYLLIYNPSAEAVTIAATFYGTNGAVVTKRLAVPPTARYTVNVNVLFAGLTPEHGIRLHALNGLGFVAEQTVFAPDYSTLASTQGASA